MWPFRRSLDRRDVGKRGETVAARFLRRHGYKILERNAKQGRYEIDLIAQEGDTLCFVEVRSRQCADPVPPEDTVNPIKQRHIIAGARYYLAGLGEPEVYCRFDVVAVVFPERGRPSITLYRDAFQPK